MDLMFDGQFVIRTKAVRCIGEEWDVSLVLGVDTIPSQVFGHRQVRQKQTVIPLSAPKPQTIDEEAEAVRGYVSDACSPSEGICDAEAVQVENAQTWEEAGLENPFSPTSNVQSPTAMESVMEIWKFLQAQPNMQPVLLFLVNA